MERYLSKTYDESFLKTDSLKYLPWVGKNYPLLPHDKKILIVADSVYNWGKDEDEIAEAKQMLSENDFVRAVVHEHGLFFSTDWGGVWNSKIARGIERSLFNKNDVSNSEREDLWPYISFHEFVQRPMSNLDEKPTDEDFNLGAIIFKDILNVLEPRTCIFYGSSYRKIQTIENEFGVEVEWPTNEQINRTYPKILNIDKGKNKPTRIIFVKHPSSYFSWDLWHQFIVKNLPSSFHWIEKK